MTRYGTLTRLAPLDLDDGAPEPWPGTILRSNGGSCYLVQTYRRVASSRHPRRDSLVCVRIDPDDVLDGDVDIEFSWYPRRKARR